MPNTTVYDLEAWIEVPDDEEIEENIEINLDITMNEDDIVEALVVFDPIDDEETVPGEAQGSEG